MTKDEFIEKCDLLRYETKYSAKPWHYWLDEMADHDAEQRQVIARLREALELLYDCQNGCPLPKYQADWDRAMQLAQHMIRNMEGEERKKDAEIEQQAL